MVYRSSREKMENDKMEIIVPEAPSDLSSPSSSDESSQSQRSRFDSKKCTKTDVIREMSSYHLSASTLSQAKGILKDFSHQDKLGGAWDGDLDAKIKIC